MVHGRSGDVCHCPSARALVIDDTLLYRIAPPRLTFSCLIGGREVRRDQDFAMHCTASEFVDIEVGVHNRAPETEPQPELCIHAYQQGDCEPVPELDSCVAWLGKLTERLDAIERGGVRSHSVAACFLAPGEYCICFSCRSVDTGRVCWSDWPVTIVVE